MNRFRQTIRNTIVGKIVRNPPTINASEGKIVGRIEKKEVRAHMRRRNTDTDQIRIHAKANLEQIVCSVISKMFLKIFLQPYTQKIIKVSIIRIGIGENIAT